MHPAMTVFVVLLSFCGGSYAVNNFADKSDLKALSSRVDAVEVTIERGNIEQAIRTIQSDIYRVERLIAKGEATERDVQWLNKLKVDLAQKLRDLERIEG